MNDEEESKDQEHKYEEYDKSPQLFTEWEFNDLVRDVALPKESAQFNLHTKKWNSLSAGASIYVDRNSERELSPSYLQEVDLVYCSNITGLIIQFRI